MIKICFNGNGFPWNQKKMNRFIYVKKYSRHTVHLLYIFFSCWPAPKYSWTPPLVFPLKMSVISQTCSGWWLPKLSQQTKNIFKVGNVIKNIAVIDVVFMSLLWYLDILLGLRIQKQKFQSLLSKAFLQKPRKSYEKTSASSLFFNQVPGLRPAISSNRDPGAGVFLWVFINVRLLLRSKIFWSIFS